MGAIQQTVQGRMAPGIEGAWASTNPRSSYVAGPGGLVAGLSGVTVGRFAWVSYQSVDLDEAPAIANNFGSGSVSGFVSFDMQANITTFLADASVVVTPGNGVTLMTTGDYWVKNYGSGYVTPGMYCFADLLTGKPTFSASNSATVVTSASTSAVTATTTTTLTGSISDNILTVTAKNANIYPGMTIAGSGVATGSKIMLQLTPLLSGEVANGLGRYALNIGNQTVASEAMTTSYGVLTLGGTPSGAFVIGAYVSATGYTGGGFITQQLTGSGGTASGDTMVVDNDTTFSGQTASATTNVLTSWYALSGGSANQFIKIGKHYTS